MILLSCQDNAQKLITKKWDCVRIENLAPLDKHFVTAEDSIATLKAEAALQSLVWTFNSNNTYSCSVSSGVSVQGTYEISADDKSLMMIPVSKNNTNIYLITSLTENELTLTSTGTSIPLIMHFRPH
jgi:hypothetical protein